MQDSTTKRPLTVFNEGTAGPYIMIPFSQLDDLRRLLDGQRVSYSVEEDIISLNGEPEVAVVNFGRKGDAKGVQALLDSVD